MRPRGFTRHSSCWCIGFLKSKVVFTPCKKPVKLTSLTSDVKQLIQRSHWEVNTVKPRKIIARKQRNTSKGFYIGDDPKVGCNCEGELFTVSSTVNWVTHLPRDLSRSAVFHKVPISYQLWIAVDLEHNPFFVSLTGRIKKNDFIMIKVFLIIQNF